jgi:transposase
MTTETRKRRNYTEDFKRDAVALVTEQGYKTAEAARSLGIGGNLIRRWRREFEEEASGRSLSLSHRLHKRQLKDWVESFRPVPIPGTTTYSTNTTFPGFQRMS